MNNQERQALDRHIDEHNNYYQSFVFGYTPQSYFNTDFWRYIVLSLNFLGVQFAWSVELSYGTPYLLSLGLNKTKMSLVWLAGPLSGLIMQPLIGSLSDRCELNIGRRRPFILAGTIGVIISLICIGWTKEVLLNFGLEFESYSQFLAIFSFFLLDFSINAIQACARALIVDILPPSKQELGSAWSARMIGLGNILGYLMGSLDLPDLIPIFGERQLQTLCGLTIIALCFTVGVTLCSVIERQWIKDNPNQPTSLLQSIYQPVFGVLGALFGLPKIIAWLCITQFFSWIGWFPFLFYATSWISDIANKVSKNEDENLRMGSRAFLFFSLFSLTSTFLVPYVLNHKKLRLKLAQFFTFGLSLFSLLMILPLFFNLSVWQASFLVTICGFSNAMSMWAPFSIIGEELRGTNFDYIPLQNINSHNEAITPIPINEPPPKYSATISNGVGKDLDAGVVLGVHNIFVTIPQIIISFLSSLIFNILDHNVSYTPTIIIFSLGGLSSLIAAFISVKLWK